MWTMRAQTPGNPWYGLKEAVSTVQKWANFLEGGQASLQKPRDSRLSTSECPSPVRTDCPMHGRTRPHLKDGDGVGVWEVVQDDWALLATDSDTLNAVQVGICPVDPVVVHGNAVGPLHILWHKAKDSRTIHVAPIDSRPQVSPVGPEHDPDQTKEHMSVRTGEMEAQLLPLRGKKPLQNNQPASSAIVL